MSLKLSHQGLLLVFVLLLLELCFVGGLFQLLNQAETEARREEHLRQIIVSTNRVIELNYVAIGAVHDFISTGDSFHEQKYLQSVNEIRRRLDWLDRNLADQPYQRELLKRIRAKSNDAFAIADRARATLSGGGSILELSQLVKERGDLKALNEKLVPDFQDLLRAQRHIEEEAPAAQRRFREQSKKFLLLGVVLNVVLAIAMAAFFTRSIISRLEVVVDNTRRLQEGASLRPPLEGKDEIARLDQVFHDMALELTESARKERLALSEAKEAESRIRQVTNSMPVGLFIVDRSATILFANPCAAAMFEYSTGDLRGMRFQDLISSADPKNSVIDVVAMHDDLSGKSAEVKAQGRSGRMVDIDLSITPFDARGEKRFLITMVDISEKLEIQRMRQAFVAMVSHDLRTPLNSVQGYLELLEMGALGELTADARDGAIRAARNIDRLIRLINDLLDLEKLESGTMTVKPSQCLLEELIERARLSVQDLADRQDVVIESQSGVTHAYADEERIVQVLVNLLSNALKFSPKGSVIRMTSSFIEEGLPALNPHEKMRPAIEISVEDEGPGVPSRFQKLIFERFQQVTDGQERARGGLGVGLGLAICKAIVEQHNGIIGVDCRAENARAENARAENARAENARAENARAENARAGSRFWFRLPAQIECHDADMQAS